MPVSLNYLAVILLAYLGFDNAQGIVDAALVLITAGVALYARYRIGGINILGFRK